MSRSLVYSNRARRDLRSLAPSLARRILQALERLAETGQGDVKRLQGRGRELRLRVWDWRVGDWRVGDWRVRLAFEEESRAIRIFSVSHRREAYRS